MTSTHTGVGVRLRWTQVDEEGGQLHADVHIKKLEPTDIILSSSHVKKFEFLNENLFFRLNKKWQIFVHISQ